MLRLLPLVLSIAASDIEGTIARKKRNGLLYALAGILALSAWFCGLWALGLALVPAVGPVLAPIYVGGALVLTALLLVAVIAILNAMDRRRAKTAAGSTPAIMTALALAAAPTVARSKPLIAAAALAALGYGAMRLTGASENRDRD
jgi:hypothetical protein